MSTREELVKNLKDATAERDALAENVSRVIKQNYDAWHKEFQAEKALKRFDEEHPETNLTSHVQQLEQAVITSGSVLSDAQTRFNVVSEELAQAKAHLEYYQRTGQLALTGFCNCTGHYHVYGDEGCQKPVQGCGRS
jgi:chromosome segregation ATPase